MTFKNSLQLLSVQTVILGGEAGSWGNHTSLLCSSFLTVSLQSLIPCKSSFLAVYSQEECDSWSFTWFLATTQNTDIHMVATIHTCHRPQHDLWRQYRPQTSTQAPAETQGMDTILALETTQFKNINMTLGGRTDHGHSHGLWPMLMYNFIHNVKSYSIKREIRLLK